MTNIETTYIDSIVAGMKLMHYKGGLYTVLHLGTHTENEENVVVYKSDKDDKVWVRPLGMFYEIVDIDGLGVPRFVEVGKRVL